MITKDINFKSVLDKFISVSDLGRGQASKVIQSVDDHKNQFIVIKNNKPAAIIMSIEEYKELMEAKENLELLLIAAKRTSGLKNDEMIEFDEVLNELGVSKEELEKNKDSVEID
ncbi:MAG: type II toxin-antitoxin system Phd/YefM family antitoxin [Clostridia bacterium]|nr:type II toxin-antitoxin system Phd/YefM family antitoxin [Clostridia bacterium]